MLEPAAAIEQLTNHQQQADMDGVFVTVSRQALEEVLDYLRTPPTSQSGDALVEELKRALAWHDYEMSIDEIEQGGPSFRQFQRLTDGAYSHLAKTIILPIITRERAAARAEGRREGIEEAAKIIDRVRLWLPNVAQLLDTIKREWEPENCWSTWDQAQRDELTYLARSIDALRAYREKHNG